MSSTTMQVPGGLGALELSMFSCPDTTPTFMEAHGGGLLGWLGQLLGWLFPPYPPVQPKPPKTKTKTIVSTETATSTKQETVTATTTATATVLLVDLHRLSIGFGLTLRSAIGMYHASDVRGRHHERPHNRPQRT